MFTPNRSYQASGGSGKNRRRTVASSGGGTPKSSLGSTQTRRSMLRRSFLQGRSPHVGIGSATSSPTLNMTMNLQSGQHSISSFGSSLPVKIMEILSDVNDVDELSVQIDKNGWAWLIHERRLLTWRYKHAVSKVVICKEFLLPKSDVSSLNASKLACVCVKSMQTDDVSLTVITPEGHVVYWPSIIINNEFKLSVMLDGMTPASSLDNKIIKLIQVKESKFAALSNQGNIYLIYPSNSAILYTKVQQSSGMLAGIGRRMSSFFFTPSATEEAVDIALLNNAKIKDNYVEAVVVTKTHMQKWKFSTVQNGVSECIGHAPFNGSLCDDICLAVWKNQEPNLKYWPLQVALCSNSNDFIVLVAVSNSTQTQNTPVKFVLCLCSQSVFNNCRVTGVYSLDHLQLTNSVDELQYNLIVPNYSRKHCDCVIVGHKSFVIVKEFSDNPEVKLPFDSPGDSIIAIGNYNNECVLLSAVNCLLILRQNEMENTQVHFSESFMQNASSPYQILENNEIEMPSLGEVDISSLGAKSDFTQRLKTAFISYTKNDLQQSKDIIETTFLNDFDHTLDSAVITLSQNLIDDHPAQDPRWAGTVPDESAGSTSSLLLQHQLKDKAQAHDIFVRFLNDLNIMNKLTTISIGMGTTCTKWLLFEHGEKLAAANALRIQHAIHPGVLDVCIRDVISSRIDSIANNGLTPRDLFYREVSRIDSIVPVLIEKEELLITNSLLSSKDIVTHITSVNEILQAILSAVYEDRRSKNYLPLIVNNQQYEYIPWTVQAKSHSIRELCIRQHKKILDKGIPEAQDSQQRAVLHGNMFNLADQILTGYTDQLKSVSGNVDLDKRKREVEKDYDLAKDMLITPLINLNLPEKASFLGEKYQDYATLVALTEKMKDDSMLSKYIEKFSTNGFCEFLFNWYIDNNKVKQLLNLAKNGAFSNGENEQKLNNFLKQYPNIAWFNEIECGMYSDAHETLLQLAKREKESALKKKQFLGLSKMSCLFSDDTADVIDKKILELDTDISVMQYQENLPEALLQRCNYNIDSMPVLDISSLIKLYIGDKNLHSNEVDFKKALELLQYLPCESEEDSNEISDLKILIWCQAILKNSWNGIESSSHIMSACSHTILFKLLQLVYESGIVEDAIPDVEYLLEEDILGKLRQSPSFQYIIRALFEDFTRTVQEEMEQ